MIFINEDITKETTGLIAHGVNCQGVMGSGVARAIRNKWPIVYEKFKENGKGEDLLGSTHIINVNEGLYVANCYTQVNYGRTKKVYANIAAISDCLDSCYVFCEGMGLDFKSVKIGCGLGGLEWSKIKLLFENLDDKYTKVNTYIFEK